MHRGMNTYFDQSRARSRLASAPRRGAQVLCAGLFVALATGSALVAIPAGNAVAAAPSNASGWIRFGHFVPSQGPVNVTVDGTVLGTNLVFRSVTSYASIAAGPHTVTVRSATAAASAPPLAVGQATVAGGGAVTAAAVAGSGASPSSATANNVELQMYTDDLSAPPPGQAKIRVIHAVPGSPVVTTELSVISAASTSPSTTSATLKLSPVGYGQASPYSSIAAGTYQLEVGPAGGPPIVTGHNWPVSPGTVSSIVLIAATTGPTIEVLSDAAGASSMPTGAMHTGYGGTAPRPAEPFLPVAAAVAAVLLFSAAAVRRRILQSNI